jgi:nucleoside-diphosphate-sugar epimerase
VAGKQSHAVDLTSPAAADDLVARVGPDLILHLAGGTGGDAGLLYELNVHPLTNVMHAAARLASPPAVIALGSAAEYGEPRGGVATETSPAEPVSAYGRAKLAATSEAQQIAHASGVRLCVVRPFNVVSARLPRSTALGNLRGQLLEQAGSRRVVRCGRVDIVRDYVPLEFVVDALATLATAEEPPPVLNVCSGTGIALADLLNAMGELLGATVTVEPVPELMRIPAPSRIVGDATLLALLGLSCRPTPQSLARTLLGDVSSRGEPPAP